MSDYEKKHDLGKWLRIAFLGAIFVFFGIIFSKFYVSGSGFSALIGLGGNHENRYLPELRGMSYFAEPNSYGYDGQWYAQMALRPTLEGEDVLVALDNPGYRARRILFSWTASALGMGRPEWVLQAYAVQNALCWMILGLLLLRVFPARDWFSVMKWAGVMLSYGLCCSVRSALLDGPSLLLITAAVMLYEAKRPWLASIAFGISGLGKETNLLAGLALANSKPRRWQDFARMVGLGLVGILPLVVWFWWVGTKFGGGEQLAGSRAFAPPFAGYWRKILELWAVAQSPALNRIYLFASIAALLSLTVQFLYIILRPQPENAWWRVGLGYAVLMVFLGDAVWEGEVGAAPRVLLPMVLVFNILVIGKMRNLALLLAGNASVLAIGTLLVLPSTPERYTLQASEVPIERRAQLSNFAEFSADWYPPERRLLDSWVWCAQSTEVVIMRKANFSAEVSLRCEINSPAPSTLMIEFEGIQLWKGELSKDREAVSSGFFKVPIGGGRLVFKHAWRDNIKSVEDPLTVDARMRAFRVYNMEFIVR